MNCELSQISNIQSQQRTQNLKSRLKIELHWYQSLILSLNIPPHSIILTPSQLSHGNDTPHYTAHKSPANFYAPQSSSVDSLRQYQPVNFLQLHTFSPSIPGTSIKASQPTGLFLTLSDIIITTLALGALIYPIFLTVTEQFLAYNIQIRNRYSIASEEIET